MCFQTLFMMQHSRQYRTSTVSDSGSMLMIKRNPRRILINIFTSGSYCQLYSPNYPVGNDIYYHAEASNTGGKSINVGYADIGPLIWDDFKVYCGSPATYISYVETILNDDIETLLQKYAKQIGLRQ